MVYDRRNTNSSYRAENICGNWDVHLQQMRCDILALVLSASLWVWRRGWGLWSLRQPIWAYHVIILSGIYLSAEPNHMTGGRGSYRFGKVVGISTSYHHWRTNNTSNDLLLAALYDAKIGFYNAGHLGCHSIEIFMERCVFDTWTVGHACSFTNYCQLSCQVQVTAWSWNAWVSPDLTAIFSCAFFFPYQAITPSPRYS